MQRTARTRRRRRGARSADCLRAAWRRCARGRPLKRWRYVGVVRARRDAVRGRCARRPACRSAGGPSRCRTARCSRGRVASGATPGACTCAACSTWSSTGPAGVEVRLAARPLVRVDAQAGAPVHVRGTRARRRPDVRAGRRRRLRRRLRRLPRAAHRLAVVGGDRPRGRRARGGLEPGGRRARRAREQRAHACGSTACRAGGAAAGVRRRPVRVSATSSFREWSAREVEPEPPGDAEPLPAAVRRVQRRRSRAVSRWPRATG